MLKFMWNIQTFGESYAPFKFCFEMRHVCGLKCIKECTLGFWGALTGMNFKWFYEFFFCHQISYLMTFLQTI